MKIESQVLNGAASIIKGWHPMDLERYSPYEFASPREELLACRKTAWIGVYLMVTGKIEVTGPDAAEILNRHCVNRDFSKLKIGSSRHALVCNEDGYICERAL